MRCHQKKLGLHLLRTNRLDPTVDEGLKGLELRVKYPGRHATTVKLQSSSCQNFYLTQKFADCFVPKRLKAVYVKRWL